MPAKSSFMSVFKMYAISILLFYVSFLVATIVSVKMRLGDDPAFSRAVVLVVIGGLFYSIYIAVVNLIQFLLVKRQNRPLIAFFFPVFISISLLLYTIFYDDSQLYIIVPLCIAHFIANSIPYVWYLKNRQHLFI